MYVNCIKEYIFYFKIKNNLIFNLKCTKKVLFIDYQALNPIYILGIK